MSVDRPGAGPPDVTVVIVSYDTRELTLACLRSLEQRTREVRHDVVVVDNASRDGSVEAIRAAHPEVRVVSLTENVGFGRAVNRGASGARGRYVLLLNPDAALEPGALDALVREADAHPEAGLYGGVMLDEHGVPNHTSCWHRPTPWSAFCQGIGLSAIFPGSRFFSPQVCRVDLRRARQEVDIVSGGFLLVERGWWARLGGFDEAFFLYGEDFDLSLRARALGARPCVFPEVRVVHPGGGTTQTEPDRMVRLLRAKAMLYERHWSRFGQRVGRLSLVLWVQTRRLGLRLARGPGSEGARSWDEVWRRRSAFLTPGAAGPPPAG